MGFILILFSLSLSLYSEIFLSFNLFLPPNTSLLQVDSKAMRLEEWWWSTCLTCWRV